MKVQVFLALLCGMLAALVMGGRVEAEPRVALVIANGDYGGDIGSLKNPVNDGKLIAAALQKVGFKVMLVTNGDQRKMKQALLDFGQALSDAGPTGTALFYYAGHGIQLNGENYLVPVGAQIRREGDVGLEALSATEVLKEVNFGGNKVQIIILDACRNTPFTRSFRGGNFGLAKIDAPIGSFVAYSTAPGSVASDGQGANSPFADALAAELQKPGPSIEEMFRNVRAKVIAETDSQQVPWDSSSLTAPFYFSKDFAGAGSSAAADQMFWNTIESSTDPADFQAYLKKFPSGTFADLAANRIRDLKKAPPAAAIPAPVPAPATTTTVAAITQPDVPSDPGSSGSGASRSELTPPPSNMKPGSAFKDCSDCPDMVVVPAGRFMMGSPDGEEGRDASEGPQHTITIARALAFSKYVVTLAQYKEFMNATGRDAGASCWYYKDEEEKYYPKEGRTFQDPGFSQTNNSPAVCLNLGDAQAYASWLSKKTGKKYRLPSEAEWEYAARAGSKTSRYWGDGTDNQCTYANGADQSYHKKYPRDPGFNPSCDDGYAFTSPVGSFKPNQFGLYDMLGDAWQFTQDCLQGQYSELDNNGEPVLGACEKHVIRGGSWGRGPNDLRAAKRGGMSEEVRGVTNSIRLVREL